MGWEEIVVVALCLVTMATGNAIGANLDSCSNMIPTGHGISEYQPYPSPFAVTASADTYSANQQIFVTLEGQCERTFKGFLMQARSADPAKADEADTGFGTFINSDSNSQPLCTGDMAITHTNNTQKQRVTMTWQAPATAQGHIVFVVTFVESFSTVWRLQRSSIIRDSMQTGALPTYDGVPSAVLASCNAGGVIEQPADCGTNVGCFDDCDSAGCNNLVTWDPEVDSVTFTIKGKFPAGVTSGYMAIGFSSDNKMGDDGVTECVYLNGQMNVYNSKNTGRSNARMTTTSATDGTGSYTDGIFECSFKLPVSNTDSLLALTSSKYLLLARSTSASASNLGKHSDRPMVSGGPTDFTQTSLLVSTAPSDTFVKVHGSLMVIAWIFAASLGIVVARHYKPQWPDSTCGGQKIWFQMHRGFMILVFLACVAAFVIIFVDVMGYSELGEEAYKQAHPILGIIVTALAVINPVMALFRPHPGTANRPIFNWAHFGVGSAAHILAVVTVFLGVNLGKPAVPQYVTWILVGYAAWQVLIEFLLAFSRCQSEKKDRSETYELSQKGMAATRVQEPRTQGGSGLRQVLLLLHIVIITSVTAAVVVIIIIS